MLPHRDPWDVAPKGAHGTRSQRGRFAAGQVGAGKQSLAQAVHELVPEPEAPPPPHTPLLITFHAPSSLQTQEQFLRSADAVSLKGLLHRLGAPTMGTARTLTEADFPSPSIAGSRFIAALERLKRECPSPSPLPEVYSLAKGAFAAALVCLKTRVVCATAHRAEFELSTPDGTARFELRAWSRTQLGAMRPAVRANLGIQVSHVKGPERITRSVVARAVAVAKGRRARSGEPIVCTDISWDVRSLAFGDRAVVFEGGRPDRCGLLLSEG